MDKYIPVNEPLLDGNELKYLNECITTNWISSDGPFVEQFEKGLATRVGRKYGIAVSNGSDALELAVSALGLREGDEVIMPSFTIISCASAIVRSGALPVLVDSDPITWNMDTSKIRAKINKNTKAIMVVHTYGLPVDMDPVLLIAREFNLKVIEDAAEAHGLEYKGIPCGGFGDISIFSFYPNKLITTGEGGMVLTDDEQLYNNCISKRNLCFVPEQRFVHYNLGWNMRMTNIQAALGVAQLERLDEFIIKKRSIGTRYTAELQEIEGIQLPQISTSYANSIFWVYGIVLPVGFSVNAQVVMSMLNKSGVGTRPFFWPMNKQPVFNNMGLFNDQSYPVAENLGKMGFYIPSGLSLTSDEINIVSKKVKNVLMDVI